MLKQIFHHTINFLFPPFCHLCDQKLDPDERYACSACCLQLQLIDPLHRCQNCFCAIESDTCVKICTTCSKKNSYPFIIGACFERLYSSFKLQQACSKGCDLAQHAVTQFMIVQLIQLHWPLPEVIIPLPSITSSYSEKQALKRVVKSIAQSLGCRFQTSLGRSVEDKLVLFIAPNQRQYFHLEKQLAHYYPKRVFVLHLII